MSFLICTPMYGGQCFAPHFQSCLNLKEELVNSGVPHDWWIAWNESLVTRARIAAARAFLQTEYECLLFIDGDIQFSPEDVAKLWNHQVPIACAPYRMKKPGASLAAWKDGQLTEIESDEPFDVDFAGTGFMMIQREVFQSLMIEDWLHDTAEGEAFGFFQDPIVDGVHLSEDYFFCEKAREAGFKILMDPSIKLTHWGICGY